MVSFLSTPRQCIVDEVLSFSAPVGRSMRVSSEIPACPSSIPMLVVFKDGKAVAKSVGYRPKSEIAAMVEGVR